jgi:hypothetical protein
MHLIVANAADPADNVSSVRYVQLRRETDHYSHVDSEGQGKGRKIRPRRIKD